MKLSIEQILNSKDVLSKIGNEKMNAVTAYKIQRNIRNLNPEITTFETSMRLLVEKYGEKKDSSIEIPLENKEAYLKELGELLKEEFEINISQIESKDITCEVTPFELMLIDWMLL